MNSCDKICGSGFKGCLLLLMVLFLLFSIASPAYAGEELYRELSREAGDEEAVLFKKLVEQGRELDWGSATEKEFEGNLRFLEAEELSGKKLDGLFLVRHLDGNLFILADPPEAGMDKAETGGYYKNLEEVLGDKLVFRGLLAEGTVEGEEYIFIRFLEMPEQLLLDRVFKTSIMFMFFFVMLGMGLNLTVKDFRVVIKRPRGIIIGLALQWLLMPMVALLLAYLLGFYHNFPFIYAGLVLICACPGGVTSNLMTYYARGDLALSVSLTSISTVLALFFTPVILTLFCANIPDINVPAGLIVQTIIGLVLVPLVLGMFIRKRWFSFASRATPFFSAFGVFALLMVIGAGVFTNAEKFAETERYSFLFYLMVVFLSVFGMLLAAGFPKLLKISSFQSRAISMEVGLRNSTLAVTIALLIQDLMGDFYSSMFVTTAIYGITMYITGFLMIVLYKKILPMELTAKEPVETAPENV